MDGNCKYVADNSVADALASGQTEICGFAGVTCPISLDWDDAASLTEGMTVVHMSLSPQRPMITPCGKLPTNTHC